MTNKTEFDIVTTEFFKHLKIFYNFSNNYVYYHDQDD
jgi:hypothetical protein